MEKSRISNLEIHQLEIVKKLDAKFEEIQKKLQNNPIFIGDKTKMNSLVIYYKRTLEVYNILFNKYIMNDDFLLMRIENILNYTLGEHIV